MVEHWGHNSNNEREVMNNYKTKNFKAFQLSPGAPWPGWAIDAIGDGVGSNALCINGEGDLICGINESKAGWGDYIIQNESGNIHSLQAEIFESLYERV